MPDVFRIFVPVGPAAAGLSNLQLMAMEWDFILRLCVAGACGTVIGLDREYRVKDAGFRTHFLVALGSALMMIVSQYGFEGFLASHDGLRLDPSRIAAQVVSGIGFIGAGTIIIHRQLVRGLTTAASLWATAGIGLAAGAHMYVVAAAATLLTLFRSGGANALLRRYRPPAYDDRLLGRGAPEYREGLPPA